MCNFTFCLLLILLKAKAEEKKLLSRRMESQEESDQDDEPKENQQLNKQSKMKDNVQRLVGEPLTSVTTVKIGLYIQ